MIVAIVGPSGSGKTSLARFVGRALGLPVVCSYTTRPKRNGEINGEDHYFVNDEDMPSKEKMLAYTKFGGYHYWTLKSQVDGTAIYVVDEEGLRMLNRNGCSVLSVYIERSYIDVASDRKKRDIERNAIPLNDYDIVFVNDGTIERMYFEVTKRIETNIK